MSKVMLVEDDNNLREIYEARLQAEGYDIVTAHDGEEALVVAKAEKPELIISDVMMPKISGFEMLDILRNTDELRDVKIIMLTALGQSDDQQRADRLGADAYLVKSQVTLEDIVKVAERLLGGGEEEVPVESLIAPAPEAAPAADAAPVVNTVPAPSAIPEPAAMPEPVATMPEPVVATAPEPVAAVAPAPAPYAPPAPAVTNLQPTVVPAPTLTITPEPVAVPEPIVIPEPVAVAAEPVVMPEPAMSVTPTVEPAQFTAPASVTEPTPVIEQPIVPAPAAPEQSLAQLEAAIVTPTPAPAPQPEPAQQFVQPAPTTLAMPATAPETNNDAMTAAAEAADVQAQIEEFANQDLQAPAEVEPEAAAPAESMAQEENFMTTAAPDLTTTVQAQEAPAQQAGNDDVLAAALQNLTGAPANATSGDQLAGPADATAPGANAVARGGGRVIAPLPNAPTKPDLNTLLAAEAAKEQAQAAVPTPAPAMPTPGVAPQPNTGITPPSSTIDPSTIAL